MTWSGIKKRFEGFVAEPLRSRLSVHITSYRSDGDRGADLGRAWVSFDGVEILSLSGKDDAVTVTDPASGVTTRILRDASLGESRQGFYEVIESYPQRSIDEALTCESFIVRGLAVLDRRVGKRRLAELDLSDEHPFVQVMGRLRRGG